MTAPVQLPAGPAHPAPARLLGEAFTDRRNALGTVRLVLALAVVASHAFLVLGAATELTQQLGAWAVNGFFALSGYLIAASRWRLGFGRFVWHRALRILPAFWVVLVAVAFVAAPLAAAVAGERWDAWSAFGYVWRNATLWVTQLGVDETLRGVPYGLEWNAPLWTLAHEATAYVVAGVALSFAFVRRRAWLWIGLAMLAFMAATFVMYGPFDTDWPRVVEHGVRLGGFFVAGMLLFAVRDRVPLRWWVAAICVAGFGVLWIVDLAGIVGQPLFAYVVLWVGARLPLRLGTRNDLSYGVYVWAFPVQQLLVVFGVAPATGVAGSFLIATVITLVIAWGSWRFVERPALGMKSVTPPWGRRSPEASATDHGVKGAQDA